MKYQQIPNRFFICGFVGNVCKFPTYLAYALPKKTSFHNLDITSTNVRDHLEQIKQIVQQNKSSTQSFLIQELSPIIRGWSVHFKNIHSKRLFLFCDFVTFKILWKWACRKHKKKNKKWIQQKYFQSLNGKKWVFASQQKKRLYYSQTKESLDNSYSKRLLGNSKRMIFKSIFENLSWWLTSQSLDSKVKNSFSSVYANKTYDLRISKVKKQNLGFSILIFLLYVEKNDFQSQIIKKKILCHLFSKIIVNLTYKSLIFKRISLNNIDNFSNSLLQGLNIKLLKKQERFSFFVNLKLKKPHECFPMKTFFLFVEKSLKSTETNLKESSFFRIYIEITDEKHTKQLLINENLKKTHVFFSQYLSNCLKRQMTFIEFQCVFSHHSLKNFTNATCAFSNNLFQGMIQKVSITIGNLTLFEEFTVIQFYKNSKFILNVKKHRLLFQPLIKTTIRRFFIKQVKIKMLRFKSLLAYHSWLVYQDWLPFHLFNLSNEDNWLESKNSDNVLSYNQSSKEQNYQTKKILFHSNPTKKLSDKTIKYHNFQKIKLKQNIFQPFCLLTILNRLRHQKELFFFYSSCQKFKVKKKQQFNLDKYNIKQKPISKNLCLLFPFSIKTSLVLMDMFHSYEIKMSAKIQKNSVQVQNSFFRLYNILLEVVNNSVIKIDSKKKMQLLFTSRNSYKRIKYFKEKQFSKFYESQLFVLDQISLYFMVHKAIFLIETVGFYLTISQLSRGFLFYFLYEKSKVKNNKLLFSLTDKRCRIRFRGKKKKENFKSKKLSVAKNLIQNTQFMLSENLQKRIKSQKYNAMEKLKKRWLIETNMKQLTLKLMWLKILATRNYLAICANDSRATTTQIRLDPFLERQKNDLRIERFLGQNVNKLKNLKLLELSVNKKFTKKIYRNHLNRLETKVSYKKTIFVSDQNLFLCLPLHRDVNLLN
jgi:hypothetical protein